MAAPTQKITGLLKAWVAGDEAAHQQLLPIVYTELRHLASRYRRKIGGGDTLQTTALVHEAYLRLVNIDDIDWQDRVHFFAVSAQLMRRILIDSARAHSAAKRGGNAKPAPMSIDWDVLPAPNSERAEELIALDDALTRLHEMDDRRGRIVELRVFGGLSVDETAEVMGVSRITINRDWKVAKAWLMKELSPKIRN